MASDVAPLDLDPLLDEEATRWVAHGYRIESRLPDYIVLVRGHRPNHVLHLLLSIVTVGLWLIVWLCIGAFGGEKRRMLYIGSDGRVTWRKA